MAVGTGWTAETNAPAQTPTPILLDTVAAGVNARVITVGDVIDAMGGERQRLLRTYRGEELSRLLNESFARSCDDLVARALVMQAFEKDGAQIPDWAVEREIQQTVRDRFNNSRSRLEEALRNDGLTLDDMRRRLREKMMYQSMRSSKVTQSIRVSGFDVRNRYDANPQAYATPSEVHVRVLVLDGTGPAPSDERREQAYALRKRMTDGEDFAAIARQASTDGQKDNGGDWGWLDPSKLRPELSAAIGELAPGGISDVVDVGGDCYIVKLEDRRGSTLRPFAEVEPLIERELREAQGRRIFEAWIGELRNRAYVQVAGVRPF
jgi:parvulin-like peptidyl-prolyl isomerase